MPFAAGVALGIWLRTWFTDAISPTWVSGALLPLSIILLAFVIHNDDSVALWVTMFLSCGLFCAFSYSGSVLHLREPLIKKLALGCVNKFRDSIDSLPFCGKETPVILKALLTADRSGLNRETLECFRKSGASHLLALSGLHLGLIYSLMVKTLSFMGNAPVIKLIRSCIIILVCSFYCIMTGAGASLVRALLFIFISETGKLMCWRRSNAATRFSGALTLQLAGNPTAIGSAGFQLSYMAMAGILLLLPTLQDFFPKANGRLERFNPGKKIWDMASLTISCQIFTFPISYLHFGSLPGHFLLANLTALPLTSIIMTCALLCLLLQAVDICPDIFVSFTDKGTEQLLFILKTVSSM